MKYVIIKTGLNTHYMWASRVISWLKMIAAVMAGGQEPWSSGVLTQSSKTCGFFRRKVSNHRFPLSNYQFGVDTVGVLTQYQPLRLNAHIGIGIPWDLDRNVGVWRYFRRMKTEQRKRLVHRYGERDLPEPGIHGNVQSRVYVLILSGDHIYKMDYEVMLE